jgi:hypothetical protein
MSHHLVCPSLREYSKLSLLQDCSTTPPSRPLPLVTTPPSAKRNCSHSHNKMPCPHIFYHPSLAPSMMDPPHKSTRKHYKNWKACVTDAGILHLHLCFCPVGYRRNKYDIAFTVFRFLEILLGCWTVWYAWSWQTDWLTLYKKDDNLLEIPYCIPMLLLVCFFRQKLLIGMVIIRELLTTLPRVSSVSSAEFSRVYSIAGCYQSLPSL